LTPPCYQLLAAGNGGFFLPIAAAQYPRKAYRVETIPPVFMFGRLDS